MIKTDLTEKRQAASARVDELSVQLASVETEIDALTGVEEVEHALSLAQRRDALGLLLAAALREVERLKEAQTNEHRARVTSQTAEAVRSQKVAQEREAALSRVVALDEEIALYSSARSEERGRRLQARFERMVKDGNKEAERTLSRASRDPQFYLGLLRAEAKELVERYDFTADEIAGRVAWLATERTRIDGLIKSGHFKPHQQIPLGLG